MDYTNQPNMVMSQPMSYPASVYVDPKQFDTPEITGSGNSGFHFTVQGEGKDKTVPVDLGVAEEPEKKKRGRNRKVETGEIVRAGNQQPAESLSGTVEETPTAYTYMETSNMLRTTLTEIDTLSRELVQEFERVKTNKFIKNKYNTLVGLSENIGSLLNTKISAIRELNSSISKSNDMDFKKMKELKQTQQNVDDDKYIADLFKGFITNPQMGQQLNLPSIDQSTVYGSGIIRADTYNTPMQPGVSQDIGYLNYMANLTPEQNYMMNYEKNPNVQECVVFDASTGAKFFQVMDTTTWQVIPNVPVHDQMFMEDTVLDIRNKVAKNNNLHMTFPIYVINEGVTTEY